VEPDSDWRVIEPEDEPPATKSVATDAPERVPRWLIAAIVVVVTAAAGLAIWATMPAGGVAIEASAGPFDAHEVSVAVGSAKPAASGVASIAGAVVVVDIEGAVSEPGLHQLPDGGRVGDAIAAAGGYDGDVDIVAASRVLNLAQKLTDGQQIHVPALGETPIAAASTAAAAASSGAAPAGLIDINEASADELDTLPGIGPVTAQKIIDARAQQPFATVDELQSRGVVGPSTFDKLRDLITVSH
jgi:competence protein ComEA